MDAEITRWIVEFLLRQPIPDLLANKIIANPNIPIPAGDRRLKKTLILRSVDAEIREGSVSDSILESLEILEALDRKDGIPIAGSMKSAYLAAAVECTVKYLGGSPGKKRGKNRYLEAVERIWRGRIGKLEVKRSELVTEEMKEIGDVIEAAVWDSGAVRTLLGRNTRNEALVAVRDYLREAMGTLGPTFLELVARTEREMKEKEKEKQGACEINNAEPVIEDVTKRNAFHRHKHVASHRPSRKGGLARITESEEDVDLPSSRYDTLSTPGVNKLQEALKSSLTELTALVKDPLPDAIHLAKTVILEMARKNLIQETSVENQSEKDPDVHGPTAGALDSEMAGKISNREPSAEKKDGKDVYAPNPSANHAVVHGQTDDHNAGIPSCSHQNKISKPSLMERNSTVRTYEWDDSIENSPEETANRKRFHLDSHRRKPVSPLKKYTITKVARRRTMKKWSLEEEDALREGVMKFGKGNWKLILNSRRAVFAERTEVDLKDKWRNMTRY